MKNIYHMTTTGAERELTINLKSKKKVYQNRNNSCLSKVGYSTMSISVVMTNWGAMLQKQRICLDTWLKSMSISKTLSTLQSRDLLQSIMSSYDCIKLEYS